MDVAWDMETGDPDDVISLLILVGHPDVRLRAVTCYPGGKDQIRFIKYILGKVSVNVPVGGWTNANPSKEYLSKGLVNMFGAPPADEVASDGWGHDVLAQTFAKFPMCTLMTGGPLGNLYDLLTLHPEVTLGTVFIQGGFAGDNVVPPEHRLKKFEGKTSMATWNFGGHIQGAEKMLASPAIGRRFLISKNVCHGVKYGKTLHHRLEELRPKLSLAYSVLYDGMTKYLSKKDSKALHDPLAICAGIDRTIIEFAEVKMFREKNNWGANKETGTNTFISVAVNKLKFFDVFLSQPHSDEAVGSAALPPQSE